MMKQIKCLIALAGSILCLSVCNLYGSNYPWRGDGELVEMRLKIKYEGIPEVLNVSSWEFTTWPTVTLTPPLEEGVTVGVASIVFNYEEIQDVVCKDYRIFVQGNWTKDTPDFSRPHLPLPSLGCFYLGVLITRCMDPDVVHNNEWFYLSFAEMLRERCQAFEIDVNDYNVLIHPFGMLAARRAGGFDPGRFFGYICFLSPKKLNRFKYKSFNFGAWPEYQVGESSRSFNGYANVLEFLLEMEINYDWDPAEW